MFKYQSLKALVDELEKYEKVVDIKVDLASVIFETLNYLKSIINVKQLDSKITALKSVNTQSLIEVLEEIKKLDLDDVVVTVTEGVDEKYNELFQELESFISEIVKTAPLMEQANLALRIDMVGDRILRDIFICAVSKSVSLKKIEKMVLSKLQKVDDNTISILWDRTLSEFDTYRTSSMQVEEGVIDIDFLKKEDAAKTRQKLAEYVVSVKPKLLISRFSRGLTRYPLESIGALRILSIPETNIANQVEEWEVNLARAISRLAFFWVEWLRKALHTFASVLEIDTNSSILAGSEYKIAKGETKLLSSPYAFLQIRKILHIASSRLSLATPVENALLQYRLGIEIMTPDIIQELSSKNELRLQRELCKFLIERDIYAFGTKFGRNEIDLIVEYAPNSFIMETKKYPKGSTLSERTIRNNLAQLQEYMQKSQMQRRGILTIYNMTDWLLCSPREWLHGQFWILPININEKPASAREKSLNIFESKDNTLIRVEKNEFRSKAG